MRDSLVIENAPLKIPGQPAYTASGIAAEVASYEVEARRNKVRPKQAG